jgi:predicted nucleic acid-binding protein
MFVSFPILKEYETVLNRSRFAFDPGVIATSLKHIRVVATFVTPHQPVTAASDPDDNKFL